jgi:hypothetical protein
MRRLRLPGWTAPAIDWLIVAVLAAGAQIQIWFQPQDLSMPLRGPRVANAVLFLLMIVPLGWRRRAPLLVLAIVMASTVVGFYALYDLASQVHPDPFLPFLLAIYSVAAHADRRRATIGGLLAAAAILAIDAPAMLGPARSLPTMSTVGSCTPWRGPWAGRCAAARTSPPPSRTAPPCSSTTRRPRHAARSPTSAPGSRGSCTT